MGTGTGGFYLGVDIGGTKTRVGLVDADHRALDVGEAPYAGAGRPESGQGQHRPFQLTAGGVPIQSAARGLT